METPSLVSVPDAWATWHAPGTSALARAALEGARRLCLTHKRAWLRSERLSANERRAECGLARPDVGTYASRTGASAARGKAPCDAVAPDDVAATAASLRYVRVVGAAHALLAVARALEADGGTLGGVACDDAEGSSEESLHLLQSFYLDEASWAHQMAAGPDASGEIMPGAAPPAAAPAAAESTGASTAGHVHATTMPCGARLELLASERAAAERALARTSLTRGGRVTLAGMAGAGGAAGVGDGGRMPRSASATQMSPLDPPTSPRAAFSGKKEGAAHPAPGFAVAPPAAVPVPHGSDAPGLGSLAASSRSPSALIRSGAATRLKSPSDGVAPTTYDGLSATARSVRIAQVGVDAADVPSDTRAAPPTTSAVPLIAGAVPSVLHPARAVGMALARAMLLPALAAGRIDAAAFRRIVFGAGGAMDGALSDVADRPPALDGDDAAPSVGAAVAVYLLTQQQRGVVRSYVLSELAAASAALHLGTCDLTPDVPLPIPPVGRRPQPAFPREPADMMKELGQGDRLLLPEAPADGCFNDHLAMLESAIHSLGLHAGA